MSKTRVCTSIPRVLLWVREYPPPLQLSWYWNHFRMYMYMYLYTIRDARRLLGTRVVRARNCVPVLKLFISPAIPRPDLDQQRQRYMIMHRSARHYIADQAICIHCPILLSLSLLLYADYSTSMRTLLFFFCKRYVCCFSYSCPGTLTHVCKNRIA